MVCHESGNYHLGVQALCTVGTEPLYWQYRSLVQPVQKPCTAGTAVLYDDKTL